ncbi:hypothetical protein [Candidatus Cyanaurora vandensis]|uniref:hypothetical protein n=1 Tax=Candidatus Cyanaurora vandensis TaxID=2714958 RepID=UPI00257DCB30|nr:hypothetical protein [Candidatus Cyanaurora vandensis]
MLSRLLLSTVFALTLSPALVAAPQPQPLNFVVTDQVVSDPSIRLNDIEFDHQGFNFTWQDDDLNLWVAKVNKTTGALIPPTGMGELLDTGLLPIAASGNGPEWAASARGSLVVYSKLVDMVSYLGVAGFNGRRWQAGLMPGTEGGRTPFGSVDYTAIDPFVRYNAKPPGEPGGPILTWREIVDPSTISVVPESTATQGRAVPGAGVRALTITIKANNIDQAAYWNLDTDVITQLTFDPLQKDDPFMFNAPEFAQEPVFITGLDKRGIGVYRRIDNVWTQINVLQPPAGEALAISAEPFIYNGRSYVMFITSETLDGPGDLWFAAIDPTNPLFRKVSGAGALRRQDPEYMITRGGVFLYYTERSGKQILVHRCDTGLGLPLFWPQY